MRSDAIVHRNLDVEVVSAGLLCDWCGKKKTMEVYPRSSWFLLLLGFALIAATLQETTKCPSPHQVPCTSGTKCSSDADCQAKELCCANTCYTKRCTSSLKGVQSEGETEGPTETDCRPYIEKALKELEIGEGAHTHQESLDRDESAEDIPTIEITDDSSRSDEDEDDGGRREASEEIQTSGEKSDESLDELETQQEAEKEVEKSAEKDESEEDVKGLSAEETEHAEDEQSQEEAQQEARSPSSVEHQEELSKEKAEILKRQAIADKVQSIPVSTTAARQEDERSAEKAQQKSEEKDEESQENQDQSVEVPQEESREETAESVEVEDDKTDEKTDEDETRSTEKEVKEKYTETDKTEEHKIASAESTEDGGCPDPSQVSCTEGEICSKHRHCEENQICCPNKCYRKRCTPGFVSEDVLEAESASEESEEIDKIEEKSAPTTPETGCPSPSEVSCTEGDLCSKHRHCGDDQICCPNSCYRKRCTTGTATSAELEAESEEDSREEIKDESSKDRAVDKITETGCPPPGEVSCTEGDLCSKHKHCQENTICCPNKCYRKRCTPGTATEQELAEEEESEEESKEQVQSVEVKLAPKIESGCPSPKDVSCTEGDLCSKHRHCTEDQICCPNKCYRKRCTPGKATPEELEAESEEDIKEDTTETESVQSVKKTPGVGCPERDDVPCMGEKCSKNRHCETGEICCANKCYRKVCIPGTPESYEEESEEIIEEKSEEAKKTSVESQVEGDCPSPSNVPCREGEKCSDDDDCNRGQICCPNTCYTKRCVAGPEEESEEKSEEVKPVQKVASKLVPSKEVHDIKEEVKAKSLPPPKFEPRKEEPKPETKKTEPKKPPVVSEEVKKVERKPVKLLKVVEEPAEEDESIESSEKGGEAPVDDLSLDTDIPTELRPRDHVEQLLKLDKDSSKLEHVQNKVYEETLKELKKLYENAIKPLETLYKYRDLSNRHFGDAEIFSKPLILFMGPWSGGKSSIINYLINNEYNETSLRTGAEPSPAYFNILTYGEEPDVIDGTELAADFTFSGLQKFGQGLEERLRGIKVPSKLLEKVNIVEIPGILEVRKQVSRVFPFNDACQWFIDRADIIFLVYDPSKLDVGPETEAILDQLKGREHQTRIILNKADQVKPEELMRVQGALIWNISPLMSSPQPPVMYTTSLWSRPYEPWAPVRLLQAQERAFLRDLRTAVDKRVENKIASARRFAVRVRNHAKMVDCYLTTYYNHKSVFGNRKQVANEIIDHPQDYHIYEGLSTLTNISRYDLPDPDVYRDFFKLNPLYEFQQLSATCTYFRGCPINRLDIAIAYDLPELIGTYKRNLEEALANANNPPKEPTQTQKTKKAAPGS